MSLLMQCIYCTEENDKLKYVKECLVSLADTVNWQKHRLIIINNSPYEEAKEFLKNFELPIGESEWTRTTICPRIIEPDTNLGTANGINLALRQRTPGETCTKLDDDLTWGESGWIEKMEEQIRQYPEIGILGLKRDDVYGEMVEDGDLLWCSDIMGTCTMYNSAMVDKIGGLVQFSPQYGFDDSVYSVRSEAAGFRNAFMKNIRITNLDEGGTEYTEWKKREANVYLQEASIYMDMIKKGKVGYYCGY